MHILKKQIRNALYLHTSGSSVSAKHSEIFQKYIHGQYYVKYIPHYGFVIRDAIEEILKINQSF